MSLKHLLAVALLAQGMLAFDAHAGASMFVDDAAITPRGRCQVESWTRVYASGQELTSVPACNWDGTEFSLGLTHYALASHDPLLNFGLKWLFRDLDQHDWGLSTSIGATWNGATNRLDGWTINLPASFALDPQRRIVVHVNLGWSKLRDSRGAFTGGVGLERVLGAHWTAIAEVYNDRHVAVQAGLRRSLGESASLDLVAGCQRGASCTPWVTLGLNVVL